MFRFATHVLLAALPATLATWLATWLAWPALSGAGRTTLLLLACAAAASSGWLGLRTARHRRATAAIAERLQRMANGRCTLRQRFADQGAPELGRSLDQFLTRVQATIAAARRSTEIDTVRQILDDVAVKTNHLALDAAAKAARAGAAGNDFARVACRLQHVAERCWQSAKDHPLRRPTLLVGTGRG